MPRANEYIARMVAALRISDPEWDISIGSPEYKILEAVAQELEIASGDNTVLSSNFDINTKVGADLDAFVNLFGFDRLQAKRATGSVTFSRGTPADRDYIIPFGTQIYAPATSTSVAIYFSTSGVAVLPEGSTQVEVPVEASVGGTAGNVAAGRVSNIAASIDGVTSVVNSNGFIGGRDYESDSDLRARWQRTVLRSIAGTEDQFLGLAYNEPGVTRAIVIGAVEEYLEQIEVINDGAPITLTSQVPDSKYNYPAGGEFLGTRLGTSAEDIGTRNIHYTYTQSTSGNFQPVFTITDPVGIEKWPFGTVLDVEHEFTPTASRNDPANGVVDKVDIFIAGEEATLVSEETSMGALTFDTTAGSATLRTNFIREDGITNPTSGHKFLPLFKTPVISLPGSITIGTVTYLKDVDYWLVRDTTTNKNSTRAFDGIEWSVAATSGTPDTGAPAANTAITIEYYYNSLVEKVNEQINLVRLVGIDTLTHRAQYSYLRFNLAVILRQGTQISQATADIESALSRWLDGKAFKDDIQIADLYDVIGSVPWVDNVRLITNAEDRNEVQTITFTATGGTYTLTFDGITTAALAFNAAAATINTELDAKFGVGQIVASDTGTTRVFTFSGSKYQFKNVDPLVINTALLTGGTATVAETTAGIGYGIQRIAEDGKTILNTYTSDIYLSSDTIPIFNDVQLLVKGVNSF